MSSNESEMIVYTPQDRDNAKRRYLQQQRMNEIKRLIVKIAHISTEESGILPQWGFVRNAYSRFEYTEQEWMAAYNDLILDMQDTVGYHYETDINGDSIRVMERDLIGEKSTPAQSLDEESVRRIVREELAKQQESKYE